MRRSRTRKQVNNLAVDELSAVDRPANAPSRFVLWKRLGNALGLHRNDTGDAPTPEGVTEVTPVAVAALTKAQAPLYEALATSVGSILTEPDAATRDGLLDETFAQFKEAVLKTAADPAILVDADPIDPTEESDDMKTNARIAALEKALRAAGVDPTDIEEVPGDETPTDSVIKVESLPESVRKQLDAGKDAIARLVALEKRDAERTRLEKAHQLLGVGSPAKAEDLAKALDGDKDALETVIKALSTSNATLLKRSKLLDEMGVSGAEEEAEGDDPLDLVAKAAAAYMEKDASLTEEQAIAKVYADNPELYEAMDGQR